MEIKTEYNLKIVITPKPLIWGESPRDKNIFNNPFTNEFYGEVYKSRTDLGRTIYVCHKPDIKHETIHDTFLQAVSKLNKLWQAEIEEKIYNLANLTVELK